MATTQAAVPSSSIRRKRWRIAFLSMLLLLILCGAALFKLYLIARSALPQVDGRVAVKGLTSKATVKRDVRGVPTIEAESLHDLFFAQGYVTAQDRLWQLDSMRRFAAGELAEILGERFVAHDREQRILSLRVAAERSLALSTAAELANLQAYSEGINSYLNSHRDRLPIEFRLLHYTPDPWTKSDCTLIAAQMVKDLNHYHYLEALTREKVLLRIGPELTADLYVNSSSFDRPPTVMRSGSPFHRRDDDEDDWDDLEDSIAPHLTQSYLVPPSLGIEEPLVIGSNNWVVSGAHTVTGKPLLSNDMHLGHQVPNLWYQLHLRAETFDVAGVSLPGMPYVIVGHNQRIAWGFTNIGPTVEDVFVEKVNGDGEFLTPDGWKPAEHRREVIHVKGAKDVIMDVVASRHGPIISELVPKETRQLALRWTLYDGIRNPFFDLDAAHNWDQFRQALSRLDAPGQNVVYADVDGNIGYQATGKIPIRAGDGALPVTAGGETSHEWTGFIPYDELPRIYNPASGIIATANSRIAPSGYRHSISTGWEAPWRAERIYKVLESGRRFGAADMLALQTDIYSTFDHYVADRMARAVAHAHNPSDRAREAADILRSWDGRMTAGSAAAAIEFEARSQLYRLLLEPKLGAASTSPQPGEFNWTTYHRGMQSVWLSNVLQQEPKRWLPTAFSNYDELLTAALEAALKGDHAGPNSWNWGTIHPVEIQHPVLGQVPLLRRWTGPGVQPQAGSGYTVKAVTRSHGPSERMTVDLANFDDSTLNLVTGESGVFLSPNYTDQWPAWYEGYTFPFVFSAAAVEQGKTHELVLEGK